MRRRLTLAVLGVLVGTLVLSVAGSLFLVRRAGLASEENNLSTQTSALAQLLTSRTAVLTDARILAILRQVGSYDYLAPVGLDPEGRFTSVPSPLYPAVMDVNALQSDQSVVGNVGDEIFVAEPVTLTAKQRLSLGGIPTADLPILIVTSRVHNPVNGRPYFVLVAGAALLVGALVTTFMARRVSEPLRRAVATTRRIADGDFDSSVAVGPHDYPELRELADAINQMSESLSRARGLERQFLLSVSHELRTPLTSIRGYAEALSDGATDDVAGAVSVIGSEARRLDRLVRDLLELAALDARRFSLELRPVDLSHVVGEGVDAMGHEASAAGIELAAMDGAGATWVQADPDRMRQILANLLENGLRFAAHRIEVRASALGEWCELSVTDDGPGIPGTDLPHVFERHFTSDRGHRRAASSGLGLAIVAELAHAMGGEASAVSPLSDQGGTRMVVRLRARGPDAG